MIAAVAEKSVQMSHMVVIIHGAFYVNLADNKHKNKHKLRPYAKNENIGNQ